MPGSTRESSDWLKRIQLSTAVLFQCFSRTVKKGKRGRGGEIGTEKEIESNDEKKVSGLAEYVAECADT